MKKAIWLSLLLGACQAKPTQQVKEDINDKPQLGSLHGNIFYKYKELSMFNLYLIYIFDFALYELYLEHNRLKVDNCFTVG